MCRLVRRTPDEGPVDVHRRSGWLGAHFEETDGLFVAFDLLLHVGDPFQCVVEELAQLRVRRKLECRQVEPLGLDEIAGVLVRPARVVGEDGIGICRQSFREELGCSAPLTGLEGRQRLLVQKRRFFDVLRIAGFAAVVFPGVGLTRGPLACFGVVIG